MATKRLISAGARDSWLGFYNSDGRFVGGTPDTPAAGSASKMYELLGVKTVPLTVPDSEAIAITGDDVSLGEFDFDSVANRGFIVDLAVYDLQLDAYLLGTNIETIAGGDWGVLDIENAPERDVCMIVQSRAKKYDSDNQGRKAWGGVQVPLATARPLGRNGFTERQGAVYRLRITPQFASNNVWGTTFASANAGTTGASMRPFRSDYPYTMAAFVGNNVLAAIPVDVEPVSVAKTQAWRDQGTALTVLSVSAAGATPRQVTLSAAPTSNAFVTLLLQYARK